MPSNRPIRPDAAGPLHRSALPDPYAEPGEPAAGGKRHRPPLVAAADLAGTEPVRVLHLYGRFHPDYTGDGIYYTRLIGQMSPSASRHEVLAFYTAPPPGAAPRESPFPVHYLGQRRTWRGRLRLVGWLIAHRADFDLVHVHTHIDRWFGTYAALRLLGKPVAFSCSLDDGPGDLVDGYRPALRPLIRRLLATVNVFVAISPQLKRSALREVAPQRVATLPQGVAPLDIEQGTARRQGRADAGLTDAHTVILHVGAVCERKNTRYIVDTLGSLLTEQVRLWIAGPELEPAYAQQVRERATSLGVADRVRFLGLVTDPSPLYAAADMFVFASHKEGFPNVYLEAMRSALPVVTTALPAMTDYLFEHGRTGLLCADATQFRDAVRRLIDDRRQARAIGAQARDEVARFGLARVAHGYDQLYRQLRQHGAVDSLQVELPGFQPRFCSDMSAGPAAAGFTPVRLPAQTRPMLCVVVDTESEFDWDAGVATDRGSVTAHRRTAPGARAARPAGRDALLRGGPSGGHRRAQRPHDGRTGPRRRRDRRAPAAVDHAAVRRAA